MNANLTRGMSGSIFGRKNHVLGVDYQHAMPIEFSYPWYYRPEPSLLPMMPDKYLSLLAPIIIYWVASGWFYLLDAFQFPFFEKYRLHEPQEITKRNRVSAKRVVVMVLVQQIVQTILGLFVLEDEATLFEQVFADHQNNVKALSSQISSLLLRVAGTDLGISFLHILGPSFANWMYWWGIPTLQMWWAFVIMDAWQYALHRSFHESRFLYKHFHSHHHRLYVPYAFGALYNHPLEGLLLDSGGAAIAHAASFMTVRQGIFLFVFSTLKTVCDHGGYAFPPWLDPLHLVFPNTAEYHDVHHQMQGLRYNYSQPFFVHFDVLFGTRMSAEKFAKMRSINQRYKLKGLGEDAIDSVSLSNNENTTLRKRGQEKSADTHSDQSPEDIVLNQDPVKDITITDTLQSYQAKAGTTL